MTTADRTAIVTGAGKRVGRAIAEALLADGWAVVAHVRRAGDEVPAGAIAAVADLADPGAAAAIFRAAQGLPPLGLLVNNAARFAEDRLQTLDSASFDSHMAVNARAPALLTQAFAAQVGDGGGLVVNLLDSKLAAPNPDFLSYTVSKMALAGLTEISARALAERGIRVNGIAPALMLRSEGQDDANFEAMHGFNPLGRGVDPADVVEALRYLIAARAVTGQIITIDGGQRFWALPRDVQFLSPSGDRPSVEKK
jgi:NAD(P)-dependent dehydrogenase (short-subunit alcohol dehydrogenase family)